MYGPLKGKKVLCCSNIIQIGIRFGQLCLIIEDGVPMSIKRFNISVIALYEVL